MMECRQDERGLVTVENASLIDLDQQGGTETAKLLEEDRIFAQLMGGLFPAGYDLARVQRVLDIGCGPGRWATDVALAYPRVEVFGIDRDLTMVHYASRQARLQQVRNVTFELMDKGKPLAFLSHSFNIINIRFMAGTMDQASWLALLLECRRILKTGGILQLTEAEIGISNSPALEQLNRLLLQTMQQHGHSYSLGGRSIGNVYILEKLLQEAGFSQTRLHPFVLDSSYGTELYAASKNAYHLTFTLLKPYLSSSGIVQEDELNAAIDQMQQETEREDFRSAGFGVTAIGIAS
ncbi:MAG TPA: methyltransferase domain-containing protein [Ktedonobacteraceae bacterium]|jgi:ubiquinone/menaquinone biosynthesis C-methylase UbiE|nr:methyltransferase domain-containing protein [Ktedonobacteraceae bacterium]